jgi:hypothetical protein
MRAASPPSHELADFRSASWLIRPCQALLIHCIPDTRSDRGKCLTHSERISRVALTRSTARSLADPSPLAIAAPTNCSLCTRWQRSDGSLGPTPNGGYGALRTSKVRRSQ